MMCLFNFLLIHLYVWTSYPTDQTKNLLGWICWKTSMIPGLDSWQSIQTLGPCIGLREVISVCSVTIFKVLSVVYYLLVFITAGISTCRMGSRDRCMHVIQVFMTVVAQCVFEPVRLHSSAESIDISLIHHRLTRRRILPFRLSVGDINDYLDEYFTDPCKCNCFAEIRVDGVSNLNIIHWDLRYNAYQHPCDLMVKPFESQPKEQRKLQH